MGKDVYNIYLTFPSDVKTVDDEKDRKKKLDIKKSKIANGDLRDNFAEVLTTSESAIKYLFQQKRNEAGENDFSLDRVFLMVSNMVKEPVGFVPGITEKYNKFNKDTTHLDVLKYQMDIFYQQYFDKPIIPLFSSDEIIEEIDCGDNLDNTDQIGENIIKLCRQIVKYKETLQREVKKDIKIKLYIDTTGGLRNAAMIFLIIGRIMSYLDIEVADVLYTSWKSGVCTVNGIKDIYDLLDLISGFEEFLMFGSVKKLNDYYKTADLSNQLSLSQDTLDDVLTGMDQFADAINISRRGDFENALWQLSQCLSKIDSEELTGSSFNYNLIRLLGEPIKKSYTPIVNESKDVLSYVEWCLERDYIQQALTLFKECVPQFLVDKGILIVDEEQFIESLEHDRKEKGKDIVRKALKKWNKSNEKDLDIEAIVECVEFKKNIEEYSTIDFVFNEINKCRIKALNPYIDHKMKELNHPLREYVVEYIEFVNKILKLDDISQDEDIIKEIDTKKDNLLENIECKIKSIGLSADLSNTSMICKLISFVASIARNPNILQEINDLPKCVRKAFYISNKDGLESYVHNIETYEYILPMDHYIALRRQFYKFVMNQMKMDTIFKKCIKGFLIQSYDFEKDANDLSDKYVNGLYNISGVVLSEHIRESLPEIIKVLAYYFEIKKSRNDSNHARLEGSSQFKTANEIKEAMVECINLIRNLTKSV